MGWRTMGMGKEGEGFLSFGRKFERGKEGGKD